MVLSWRFPSFHSKMLTYDVQDDVMRGANDLKYYLNLRNRLLASGSVFGVFLCHFHNVLPKLWFKATLPDSHEHTSDTNSFLDYA